MGDGCPPPMTLPDAKLNRRSINNLTNPQKRSMEATMADTIDKSTLTWVGSMLFLAVTTTAAGVHFLHEQYITPIKVFENEQKIKHLSKQLETQKEEIENIEALKNKLSNAQSKLNQIEHKDLFLKGEIYPATIYIAKLGEDFNKIYSLYDPSQIEIKKDRRGRPEITVHLEQSVFREIAYGYDETTKKIIAVHMFIDTGKDLADNFLEMALTSALGIPIKTNIEGQFRWNVPGKGSAFLITMNTYSVLDEGYAPLLWGDELKE